MIPALASSRFRRESQKKVLKISQALEEHQKVFEKLEVASTDRNVVKEHTHNENKKMFIFFLLFKREA
jgi:hypothetical protein